MITRKKHQQVFPLIALIFAAILTIACALGDVLPQAAAPTPTEPPPTATEANTPTATIDHPATESAQTTADALLTVAAEQTAEAQAAQATDEANAQKTQSALDLQATATQAKSIHLTETAEIAQQATAQAEEMSSRLEFLVEDGIIPSVQGEYTRLKDFDESWAQMNWFQWWTTGQYPENFAIRTDVNWNSASETANWFNSGCGFVFGLEDNNNFHVMQVRLDSTISLRYWHNGNSNWIAQRSSGKLDTPNGEAEIMMVVYDKRVTVFINGEEKLGAYASILEPGALAFTLSSGTNKGFGTRCQMENIDLWTFEQPNE